MVFGVKIKIFAVYGNWKLSQVFINIVNNTFKGLLISCYNLKYSSTKDHKNKLRENVTLFVNTLILKVNKKKIELHKATKIKHWQNYKNRELY